MAKHVIKLRIADTIIQMQSSFPLEQFSEEEKRLQNTERFNNFFYSGRQKPDIVINIDIVDKLPKVYNAQPMFITRHFEDGSENWCLLKKGNKYIFKCLLEDRKQLMLINKVFNRITAYLLPKEDKGSVWSSSDIIYDFLQVLLINYFAQRNEGIFTHSIGIKDSNGKGLLFTGKSGCGKTTTARLWHNHSKAMVLNDDRIIVRKTNKRFFIYGSPWHGEFSDYLASRIESAPLEKLFFIYHSSKNTAKVISQMEAFTFLYPALFPTFWDKGCLESVVAFCEDLVRNVSCYSLGFINNKRIIKFVRRI